LGGVEIPDFDLFTYSFPCTDISNAGTQRGFEEGSGTRSSLLWECRRAIATKRPKYLLMENVNALLQKKFLPHFKIWTDWLEEQGYRNFYQVLNAKDFGVPQNRRRVFMVSIRDDGDNPSYTFPQPFPLKKRLKDILEKEVNEGFYLRQEQVQRIVAHCEHTTHSAVSDFRPEIVGHMNSSQDGAIYNPEKISPCHTGTHGNTPMITADNQCDITPPTTPNAMRELL
jgi:DNA-cytosine methyltransferase